MDRTAFDLDSPRDYSSLCGARRPIDGGEPKLMAEFETDCIFGYDWSCDRNYLACVRGLWATNVVLIKNFR